MPSSVDTSLHQTVSLLLSIHEGLQVVAGVGIYLGVIKMYKRGLIVLCNV